MKSSYWDKTQTEFVRIFNLVDGISENSKKNEKKKIDASAQGSEGFIIHWSKYDFVFAVRKNC